MKDTVGYDIQFKNVIEKLKRDTEELQLSGYNDKNLTEVEFDIMCLLKLVVMFRKY